MLLGILIGVVGTLIVIGIIILWLMLRANKNNP
jgi:hypothetical protein